MSTAAIVNTRVEAASIDDEFDSSRDTGGLGGHPRGLTVLFFTEMWERFSYYGMRAILILYMVALPTAGGLGFPMEQAAEIYGTYTMSVYLGSIPGGLIADRFLGQRLSIMIGGSIIALGHFTLAFRELPFFYTGLALIVIGTGLLKPNMSTLVGKLYSKNDSRRDAGFSIYYMGINIGAAIAPLVCGFLAQAKEFKVWLESMGLHANDSWHWGFAAAGVGMSIGLTHMMLQSRQLGKAGLPPQRKPKANIVSGSLKDTEDAQAASKLSTASLQALKPASLSGQDWMKLGALAILFVFTILFWAVFEQGGSSLNVFADKLTNCSIFGHEFPSSWFQSVQAIFVIMLAPVFSWLWIKLGRMEPGSPAKFAFGLLFLALGTGVMVPAAMLAANGKVGLFWLCACYFLQTVGELCLSPVGLSTVTKLAPVRICALVMGVWYLGPAFGNKLAGFFAGFFKEDTQTLVYLYGGLTGLCLVAALLLFFLKGRVSRLMGDVK